MNELETLIQKSLKELETVELLIQHDSFNTAVSRTYYAMFYAVQAIFLENKIVSSSHNGTISTFSKMFVNTGIFPRKSGRALNDVYEMRQTSDYDYMSFVTIDKAKEILNIGKDFVKTILEHIKNKPK